MFSLTGNSNEHINHFRCTTADYEANKHIPDSDGYVYPDGVTKVKLKNGDELYIFKGDKKGDVLIFDEECMEWESQ